MHIFCISFTYQSEGLAYEIEVHILYILYILYIYSIFCILCLCCAVNSDFKPGYEMSDDDDEDILPSRIQDHQRHGPDHPSDILQLPAPVMALPPPPPPTFDFHSFMRRSGGKLASLFRLIQELDALLPQGPIIVHSQRAGGGVRLLYFAYFAYSAFH